MRNKIKICLLFFSFILFPLNIFAENNDEAIPDTLKTLPKWDKNRFQVLCWHDIPDYVSDDKYGVSMASFIKQLEFMRDYGCSFVSADDILKAANGEKDLPEKAVLLTFDDAYSSFYKNVFPILKLYKYPCVLAVVSSWLENPPDDPEYKHGFMTWAEIKELSDSGLVEIASHSYNSHQAFQTNPQGNTAPALITRIYDQAAGKYEDSETYHERIYKDFETSSRILEEKTGKKPKVMVWPYGRYTTAAVIQAQRAGFKMMFTLNDGLASTANIQEVPRHMITGNPSMDVFAKDFRTLFKGMKTSRIIQADLDLVYDKDQQVMNKNIDALIERIYGIFPSAVYLQAYSDDDADGNIRSVYFPNSVLPVKADIFSRVSRALGVRGIQVYAWMPTLSICLPDKTENDSLRIRERKDGADNFSTSWYTNRLSPFSEEAVEKLETLYEDLASNSVIDGVIFQDDAYLNDFEDFSVHGLHEYKKIAGDESIPFEELSSIQKNQWTSLKTDKIIEVTERLKKKVLYWRPTSVFFRTIYPVVLLKPESEEWFAQNYAKCLQHYDFTVIMAYPDMEGIFWESSWLRKLVKKASVYPNGLNKTVFKTQAYDWADKNWTGTGTLLKRLRVLAAAGAKHLAYYPDDYTVNEPDAKKIRTMMSIEDFPVRAPVK